MYTVFENVFVLMAFALIGYLLSKRSLINKEYSRLLSGLLVYLFLPCKVFENFANNFTLEYITTKYTLLITSAAVLILLMILIPLISKLLTKNGYEQKVYTYSMIVPNSGYMGYSLAETLFGETALLNLIVSALPINFYIYTVGYCMLTKTKMSLKNLVQPVFIALLLGCIAGLTNLQLPNAIASIINTSGSCMAPISMILTGIVISEFNIKPLFTDIKSYIVSLFRLVIIPCVIAGILQLFCDREIVMSAVMLYSMPCGLNTVVFPKLVNESCENGAKLACISCLGSCITIPLVFTLFGM